MMNILTLGHSGAGKTTFLLALYAQLIHSYDGFSIEHDASELYRAEELARLIGYLKRGHYPEPSNLSLDYKFHLCKRINNRDRRLSFTLYDYRGGALSERSTESPDVGELHQRISNADAVIAILDGEALMQNLSIHNRHFDRLLHHIHSAICQNKNKNRWLPVSFVVTKGDKYGLEELLTSEGFMYFKRGIMSNIVCSDYVKSCYTVTKVNSQQNENTALPLLFSILHSISRYSDKIVNRYEEDRAQMGLSERLFEWLSRDKKTAITRSLHNLAIMQHQLSSQLKKAVAEGQVIEF